MEKVLGIIAEYNPFHNGHLYHLEHSKKITNSKYSIAVISGNFTQRGDTSIVDKWSKTEMAIQNGVDLVLELPLLYSISSAENFATGAIKILDSLNIIDNISFGSECEDISILNNIAEILCNEPSSFKTILASSLDSGLSYPKARELALSHYFSDTPNFLEIISSPNNILGIEYIKALKKLNSKINPISISRINNNYNDIKYSGNIASATSIRTLLKEKKINELYNLLPKDSYQILNKNIENGNFVPDIYTFEKEIIYSLRKMQLNDISRLAEVSEGLEFKLKKSANSCNNLINLLDLLKSKRYTISKLRRILLYVLLGITKNDLELSKNITPYIRILGFNENGKKILSNISKKNPNMQIITSVKNFMDLNTNNNLKLMLQKDILATNIYTLGFTKNSPSNLDYTHKIIYKEK